MADPIGQFIYRALERLRARYRNPTRHWLPATISRLQYDMATRALNGLRVGAPLDALAPLGPADWFAQITSGLDLHFYPLGLTVGLWECHVTSYEILSDPACCPDRDGHPFAPGRVTLQNLALHSRDLTRTTTEHEVLQLLGKPFETGPVVDQRVHTFINLGSFINTYHDTNTGRLVRVEFSEAQVPQVARDGAGDAQAER